MEYQTKRRIYFVYVRKDIYNGIDIKLPEIENNVIELDKFMLKKKK